MKYSLEQLQELAKAQFERLGVSVLYGTTDGQLFILENRANLHANKKMAVYKITKDDAVVSVDVISLEALKVRVEAVEGEDGMEALKEMMFEEVQGQNRKEAIDIITDRIKVIIELGKIETVPYILTEEDMKRNPEFEKEGLKAGDTIQMPKAVMVETEKALTVKEIVGKVATMEDVAELNTMLEAEKSGGNRVSAIKAIEARIQELSA